MPPSRTAHGAAAERLLHSAPRFLRVARGQAAVEFVAVLPLVAALLAGLWQMAVFAHTAWSASSAAHAAARAEAVGLSPGRAARGQLPTTREHGLPPRPAPHR